MIYKFFQPLPALQAYVKTYLLLHFDFSGLSLKPFRSYTPRPEQCLTFDPRGRLRSFNKLTGTEQCRSRSYFSGQQAACYDLYFEPDYLMLKVVFQPGALFELFGIPLTKFGNSYVDAESVFNKEISLLNEQLANAEDYEKMIDVVQHYLLHKVTKIKKKNQPIDNLAYILDTQPHQFALQWFASQACLSARQFERKFIERIGVGAKLYCRIARFHKAFEMKESHPDMDWLSVAIACGYSDFQHLNKDFKQFSTLTPSKLLKEQSQVVEKILKLV